MTYKSLLLAIAVSIAGIEDLRASEQAVGTADDDTANAANADDARQPAEEADDSAERPVTFELGTGLEYDSNVAVLELDTASNAGDAAAVFDFGVGYDKPSEGRFDFRAGYNLSQTRHEEFSGFDVGIHRGSARLAWDLEQVDTGATFQYAHAELDGDEFLVLEQVSPYIQRLMGERLFLRFALAHTEKTFAGNPARDATAASLSSDAYVFVNGLTTYFVFGHRYNDENAVDEQYDYTGHNLKLQLNRRFDVGTRTLTLRTYLRYETRDYPHPTVSIGEPRSDDRYQLEAQAELPITDRVTATFGYKHADNRSNLPSLDFAENVVSVQFNAEFR